MSKESIDCRMATNRQWVVWLAPWSTWSFTIRLTILMTEKLDCHLPDSSNVPVTGELYPLAWKPLGADEAPDIRGLPSVDHALYMFHTVKFHLSQHYRFFEDSLFVDNLHEFYLGGAQAKASSSRIWFAQFLIVLAFGTAFLTPTTQGTDELAGKEYFLRAMALLSDNTSIWKESLLAIETLALAALYLYCIDYRESALLHVCFLTNSCCFIWC